MSKILLESFAVNFCQLKLNISANIEICQEAWKCRKHFWRVLARSHSLLTQLSLRALVFLSAPNVAEYIQKLVKVSALPLLNINSSSEIG